MIAGLEDREQQHKGPEWQAIWYACQRNCLCLSDDIWGRGLREVRKKALHLPWGRASWAERRASTAVKVGMEVSLQNSRDTMWLEQGFGWGGAWWLKRDGLRKVVEPDLIGPGKDKGQATGSFPWLDLFHQALHLIPCSLSVLSLPQTPVPLLPGQAKIHLDMQSFGRLSLIPMLRGAPLPVLS